MKNITPVTLPAGDYVIVAKGYHTGEKNGNIGIGGGPYPVDNGGGAITFGNESLYGPDNPTGFSYPGSTANGSTHDFLAGTFNFTNIIPCTLPNDATLSNLVLSQGALAPSFAQTTTNYNASVANNITSITVTPTAADAGATIKVNGIPVTSGTQSGSIALAEGSNIITITVTAQDGITTKTYTINETRAAAAGMGCESSPAQAYTANTQTGNQSHKGELGLEFTVNNAAGIIIKQLGAFDDGGDGINGLQPGGGVRVAIFNKATHAIVPGLDVTVIGLADAYAGNHRMKNITPVSLPPGEYVIVAKGYYSGEKNGNVGLGGGPYPVDNNGGAITFGNENLYGPDDANGFNYPGTAGTGSTHQFLAGTFNFTNIVSCVPSNCESAPAQAYASNTQTGNQSHRGELGLEFTVNNASGITVKQLGAFDDGGNGITGLQPGGGVRVAIFNKSTHTIVPGLDATIIGNSDTYSGNHQMKNISPVTLPPGDYVIVAKGYHGGEKNGNVGIGGGPYPVDNGGGAITFGNESLYGPDDPIGFNYPGSNSNGTTHEFLAGTFNFTVNIPCPAFSLASVSNSVKTTEVSKPVVIVKAKDLKVYPNPTNGQFNLQIPDVSGSKLIIRIINSNGKIVEQKTISITIKTASLVIPFNLVNLPSGIYLINTESNDGIRTEKLIIQR
jgi:Cadherin-like beta sandwich domain/Secretion system C-terminal sorting domain